MKFPRPQSNVPSSQEGLSADGSAETPAVGRPSLLEQFGLVGEVGEALRSLARSHYLRYNRTRQAGSYSLALRLMTQHPLCPPEFRAWVEGRKNPHHIPRSLREWMEVSAAVVRYHRAPYDSSLAGLYVPDSLRMHHERGDRLRAGDRFSADDGSVNFVFYVPWPCGGCPCSSKYGVKVGRYQLLVAHDDGSGYVPHFSWILREKQSYRAEDIVAFMHAANSAVGLWDEALLEQGSWKSHRVTEYLQLTRTRRSTAYEAQQKPVENWWNRAWTLLSDLPGQIGRFRGEEEAGAAMVERYRRGSVDPRQHLLSIEEVTAQVAKVIATLNQREIQAGPLFGSWVPSERWLADLAQHPMRQIPQEVSHLLRPERRELMVRRWGVAAIAQSPLGFPARYVFADECLFALEGEKVIAYFDPQDDPTTAAIWSADGRRLIVEHATCVSKTPHVGREGHVDWDPDQLERARAAKAKARDAVRREHRSISPDGGLAAWRSEQHSAKGSQVVDFSRGPEAPLPVEPVRIEPPATPAPKPRGQTAVTVDGTELPAPRRSLSRPEPRYQTRPDEEIDIEELDRLEAEARRKGLLSAH